jgi:L-2-hydroxyglutarate oxidase LhgO
LTQIADIVIVGAGILGLSLARELLLRDPARKIILLEKESSLGKHSSGRNSGVLHSGIYYPTDSIKARVCAEGAKQLAEYCEQYGLPIHHTGKVVIPTREADDHQLDMLYARAKSNGARAELIDRKALQQIEPEAYTPSGRALYSPDTAVIDPLTILHHLGDELTQRGVRILFDQYIEAVNPDNSTLKSNGETICFGHVFNTAGLHADQVAKSFGVGRDYTILPFKGTYYELASTAGLDIRGLIYPVPDLRVPFLGVHFTKALSGKIYIGPSALPVWGRENYHGLEGVSLSESSSIFFRLAGQYLNNHQGFRVYAHEEATRLLKRNFVAAAKKLVPRISSQHLLRSEKVGIRAQLLNTRTHELAMDFIVEQGEASTHILNAVSPAFTSAFSFAKLVIDQSFARVK